MMFFSELAIHLKVPTDGIGSKALLEAQLKRASNVHGKQIGHQNLPFLTFC
jgi:hypothetical protein